MKMEIIDKASGWTLDDIKDFKRDLLKDLKQAQGDYGLSDYEVNYILNYEV